MNIRQRLKEHKRIIVKVGTATITYPNGRINLKKIGELAWVLSDLRNNGMEVVLVSSGSIGVGAATMGYNVRPTLLKEKQAAAAVGQAALIQIYQSFFRQYGQTVAQILLTKEDIEESERRGNLTNTFETLLEMGIIPIVNANDSISTYEIEITDNDSLSAHVAGLLDAGLLIILTDIDSMYDSDPKNNPDAKRISVVERITDSIEMMAGEPGSKYSVGGMRSKVNAAKICAKTKSDMVIVSGDNPTVIHEVFEGKDIGTLFLGK